MRRIPAIDASRLAHIANFPSLIKLGTKEFVRTAAEMSPEARKIAIRICEMREGKKRRDAKDAVSRSADGAIRWHEGNVRWAEERRRASKRR
jgi:hypothetical protein